ncbi:MAG: glutamine-hydrolyzing GMP synthase, partial [Melioribacteraceae bacterium]|nr:glutamine-hydrolyzing GMP synthase [Melioribacteraceae bacterium]
MQHNETILILDFGSQYTQLIARRIREENVYCEIHPHTFSIEEINSGNISGIVLSGGPMSVYDEDAPQIDSAIFDLGIPILGICYGLQLITKKFNGHVEPADDREYGKAHLELIGESKLLKEVKSGSTVWMSHGDYITQLPDGFELIAKTDNSPVCGIENSMKSIFGLQFHPEVVHTEEGKKIVSNFIFDVCGCTADWTAGNFIDQTIS